MHTNIEIIRKYRKLLRKKKRLNSLLFSYLHCGSKLVELYKNTYITTVGNNVLIAPNVQIYTATHPVDLNERLTPVEALEGVRYVRHTFALPVTVEDGCWIGGGVIILPGVTIGKGSVIGAGSVVTKNVPANSLAVGNPCRVIRQINKSENYDPAGSF